MNINISPIEASITFVIASALATQYVKKANNEPDLVRSMILGFIIAMMLYLLNNIYDALKKIYGQFCKSICGCSKIDSTASASLPDHGNHNDCPSDPGLPDLGDLCLGNLGADAGTDDSSTEDVDMAELERCLRLGK